MKYCKRKENFMNAQVLSGFRDHLPERMNLRQKIILQAKEVFESFGFVPIETPALEYTSVLLGKYGEEGDKLLYRFNDNGGRDIALRYDLTVPLARVVSMYPLPKPFKRYQITPVWRAEKPQKGRFREFCQCDVDIVGSSSYLADAECVQIAYELISKVFGSPNFKVRINNRKILNGLVEYAGFEPEKSILVFRAIDKLPKVGESGVKMELKAGGLSDQSISRVFDFMKISGSNTEMIKQLKEVFSSVPATLEGVENLENVFNSLKLLGVPEKNVVIDLSIARGLTYYTGIVYETFLDELPNFGSMMSGGRFDELISKISDGKQDIPAVGISMGLDRLVAAIEELGLAKENVYATAQVLVTTLGNENKTLQVASNLRNHGIKTELYLGKGDLRKQMKYANATGVPFVAIIGEEEARQGNVSLKIMATGAQVVVSENNLATKILSLINQ